MHRRGAAGLIAVGVLAVACAAQSPQWTPVAPLQLQLGTAPAGIAVAGPLEALAIPPQAQANEMLAAGPGGVWALKGDVWQSLSNGEAVSALAEGADGTLYAGTGDETHATPSRAGNGILVLRPGTASWDRLGAGTFAGLAISSIVVDPNQAQHLLAATVAADDSPEGTQPGLYASEDGGASWALVLAGANQAAMAGETVLAVGGGWAQVSLTGGAVGTFSPLLGLPSSWTAAAVSTGAAGGFLLLLSAAGGAGSVWTVSADGVAAELGALPATFADAGALSVAQAGSVIWAGGTGLWVSSDAGQSWTQLAIEGSQQHALVAGAGGSAWVANNRGLWQVAPSGTLQSLNAGLANAAPLALAVGSAGLTAALDGASEATASPKATTWQVNEVTPPQDAGLNGTAWWTGASAVATGPRGTWTGTWSGQLNGPGGINTIFPAAIGGIAIANASVWVASGTGIYRSQDGGFDWSQVGSAVAAVEALGASVGAAGNTAGTLALADAAGVQLSFDGGAHWSAAIPLPIAAAVTALAFTGLQTLWAATRGRGVWALALPSDALVVNLQPAPVQATAGTSVIVSAVVTTLGSPVVGIAVAFSAVQGGSTLPIATATTDSNGLAQTSFSPQHAGAVALEATAGGVAAAPAQLAVEAAAASHLDLVAGANQAQVVGTSLSSPMVLAVEDAFGNAVVGAPVALTVSSGTLSAGQGTSDAQGQISLGLVLPNTPGVVVVQAETPGLPALVWQEQALPVPDFSLALSAPTQPVPPGQLITVAVGVIAMGGFDQPVALQCVQPVTGCTLSPATLSPGQVAVATVEAEANNSSMTIAVTGNGSHLQSVSVPLQSLQLSAQSTTLSLGPGAGSANTVLTLASINGLSGTVQFQTAMSGGSALPSGVAAAIQPASLPLAAGGTPQVQLAVTAAAAAAAESPPATAPWQWLGAGLLLLAAVGIRPRRSWRPGLIALLAMGTLACGGGGMATPPPPPPPPQVLVYDLQVTASLAGLQASVPITVTVTR